VSTQDGLVAAVKTALLEAADQMAWVDLPDRGSEAVLDGRFDLSLLAASLHASGYRPPARVIETVTELDALPYRSRLFAARTGNVWFPDMRRRDADAWRWSGSLGGYSETQAMLYFEGPMTVLWESGDPR